MVESSGEISPRIARQRAQAHDQTLDSVAASVKGLQPNRILDVGTGYGMNLTFLAGRFGKRSRIWSVDASPGVVHEIKTIMKEHQHSRHVVVKQANAERLPFKSDHFELVVSLFSLHHFSNAKRGLLEMSRVLSKGGKLIIADWTPAAARPLMLHTRSDIPSPSFVIKQLKRLSYRPRIIVRRYWYLIEAMK
jgi:ubiquinone/menaquinone biosynthesis C-methylase UbiE